MASKRFLQPINLLNATSDPTPATAGDFYYNTSNNRVRVYDGSSWLDVSISDVTVSDVSPSTPKTGDIWFNNVDGNLFIYDGTFWQEATSLISLLFVVGDTPPASPIEGQAWFDNTSGSFYVYDGTFWQEVVKTLIVDLSADTAPTLSADLDANSFGIENVDHISFDTTSTYAVNEGELTWNSSEGTLDLGVSNGVVLQIGQEFYTPKTLNNSGVEIPNGSLVMATGVQGDQITVAKLTPGLVHQQYILGVATETIAIGSDAGKVTVNGIVRNIDTSAWEVGDILYPGADGTFTTTQPSTSFKKAVAIVLRKHANTGRIYVRVEPSESFDDLDNVDISGIRNGEMLVYDSSVLLPTQSQWVSGDPLALVTDASMTYDFDLNIKYASSDPTASPWLAFFRSQGTIDSPTSVAANDKAGSIVFHGYSSEHSAFRSIASIESKILTDPDDVTNSGNSASNLVFSVTDSQGTLWSPFVLRPSPDYSYATETYIFGPLLIDAFNNDAYIQTDANGEIWFRSLNQDIVNIRRYSSSLAGVLNFQRSLSNTLDIGSGVTSGSSLGIIAFEGYDTTGYATGAEVRGYAEGTWSASSRPSALRFYTTPDGSTSVTERMRINNVGLITGSGQSLGSWNSFSPTLNNWGIGDGTISGKYVSIGKIMLVRIEITFGSTSTFSGVPYISTSALPSDPATYSNLSTRAYYYDSSAGKFYNGTAWEIDGLGDWQLEVNGTNGAQDDMTSTTPFTWASGDKIAIHAIYEIA